jgi:hypothetical protein
MLEKMDFSRVFMKKTNLKMFGVGTITWIFWVVFNLSQVEVLKRFTNSMNCEDQQMVV